MSFSKKIPFILLLVSLILLNKSEIVTGQSSANIVNWVVQQNSTLQVQGKSNVNSFTCNIKKYVEKDTIRLVHIPYKPIRFTGHLQIDIVSFNCHSSLITNDFRKTLKSKEYPKMIIRFLSLETMPSLREPESIKGLIEVELAGVVKQFELCYLFSKGGFGVMHLNGGRTFCFSDFELTPPKKLSGLIKIKDEFDVNFQLLLQAV